jgi:hypothetical protein
MFKSADERAAEKAREQAAQAERIKSAEEERQRAEFLASPIGRATTAKEAGQEFFEIQLPVGTHAGSAGFGSADGRHSTQSSAVTLGEIEKLGWRLEHAGYVYLVTRESSTDHFMVTGQEVAVSGTTMGVYLFRNAGT